MNTEQSDFENESMPYLSFEHLISEMRALLELVEIDTQSQLQFYSE